MKGMAGIRLEILSETVNEGVQGPRRGVKCVSPDMFEEFTPFQYLALVFGEESQKDDLAFGQVSFALGGVAAHRDQVGIEWADRDVGIDGSRTTGPLGSSEDAPNTDHQLLYDKGLGQIVVPADAESQDLVCIRSLCGQKQDGNSVATFTKPAADLQPVDAGKHDIQDHKFECRASGGQGVQRCFSRMNGLDLEIFEHEIHGQATGQSDVVLDDQQADRGGCEHQTIVAGTPATICLR